jgi:hypothetical protein
MASTFAVIDSTGDFQQSVRDSFVSASVNSARSISVERYHSICKTEIDPLQVKDRDGNTTFYVFEDTSHHSSGVPRDVSSEIIGQYSCYYCNREVKRIYGILDSHGHRVFFGKNFFTSKNLGVGPDCERYARIAAAVQRDTVLESDVALKIVLPSFNDTRDVPPFIHWGLHSTNVTTTGRFSTDPELLQKAFWRYRDVLSNAFSVLNTIPISEMVASVELFKKCAMLPETTYGSKFLPAADWILDTLRLLQQELENRHIGPDGYRHLPTFARYAVWVQSLVNTFLTRDSNSVVAPVIQTAKDNVLDLLALANSEAEMVKLIRERLDPLTYKRPVAAPSIGNVNIARSKLGDFQNTVLTVKKLETYPGCFVVNPTSTLCTTPSSLDAFNAMVASASKVTAPKSFAAKCRGKLPPGATYMDLLTYLRDNPNTKLQVEVSRVGAGWASSGTYIAETTLDRSLRKRDLFWSFSPSNTYHSLGLKTITHIFEYHTNIFFIIGEAPAISTLGGCCFPEFLDFSVERECGRAFEALNNLLPTIVPKGEPLAIGVGNSFACPAGALGFLSAASAASPASENSRKGTTFVRPMIFYLDGVKQEPISKY